MLTQVTEIKSDLPNESYQLIRHEHLQMVVVSAQVLTSCRILLSTYKQVVFTECNFYACDFNGIDFDGCIFENCTFEFTHFRKCNFKNCNFSNCTWTGTSALNSSFEACDLDRTLNTLFRNGRNTITSGNKNYSTDIYIQLALAS